MDFFIDSLIILAVSAFLTVLTARFRKLSESIFLISLVTSSVLGLAAGVGVLLNRGPVEWRGNFRMPFGEFFVGIDCLSAFFVMTIIVLFLAAGIYGYRYLKDDTTHHVSAHFAFYQIALMALLLVVTAKNAVLFLFAWEMMTLSSYFLIVFQHEHEEVRKAGYLYLIVTHTGTFCLWIMFLLMGQHSGSMNFDQMQLSSFPLPLVGIIFILALIGFGVKAGFIPFHIWLPQAHPVAPSHVSAVLSGVFIKTGIYGLMRIIFIIKDFPDWCALTLLFIGMISGVGGVLYALGQHEIKKLLAYHSIENIGIITLGLGAGLWGQIAHHELVALIGYSGALLHVFNHTIFKGLLFLSAGSVIRSTHTGEMDHLGGLLKAMPWTGNSFLVGSLAICGLPLFNGFVSEWLVFRSLFEGLFHLKMEAVIFCSLAIVALALIGSLAAACFAKAFGAVFLGKSRSLDNASIKENPPLMCSMMGVLAGVCLWVGLFPRVMVSFALSAAGTIAGVVISPTTETAVSWSLSPVVLVLAIVIIVAAVLTLLKIFALRSLTVESSSTWSCGYALPTARMQYSASSFAQPILRIFHNVLGYQVKGQNLQGYFPAFKGISSQVADFSEDFLFRPLFAAIAFVANKLKIIQYGYTQLYLLYIFIFLLILLIWKMI